jgi:predicted RNA polymerase sigma factor
MHYRIIDPPDQHAASIMRDLRAWLAQDREMQRDRKRLVTVCCSPRLPMPLQGAPRPASVLTA